MKQALVRFPNGEELVVWVSWDVRVGERIHVGGYGAVAIVLKFPV